MSAGPPTETGSIEIPKPRFQPRPYRATPAKTRKPLPRHIVKQILDASNARPRSRHPLLLEMQALGAGQVGGREGEEGHDGQRRLSGERQHVSGCAKAHRQPETFSTVCLQGKIRGVSGSAAVPVP